MNKLRISLMMAIFLLLNLSQVAYATDSFPDVNSHWAKKWIDQATLMGFVSGYDDGTFKPDKTVSRAEFSKLLNNAMLLETTEETSFKDVKPDEWFFNEIKKSVGSGIFSGYEDNTFRPNSGIRRQEAAKVISSAITTKETEGDGATRLTDYNKIADWAKQGVNFVYNKGYMLGYPDGTYAPEKELTRAEAVKIILDIVNNENIEHGINITNINERYQGAVVVGNLNILDSVGNQNIYIDNVVVLGDIVVNSKSLSKLVLSDVKARNILVMYDFNPLTLELLDNVKIKKALLPSKVLIQKIGSNISI